MSSTEQPTFLRPRRFKWPTEKRVRDPLYKAFLAPQRDDTEQPRTGRRRKRSTR